MTLWDWTLQAYARPGVEPACLVLQDQHGQSVAYLLWAAWSAAQGRVLSSETLKAGAALALRWDAEVLSGLRQARRGMKSAFDGLDDDAREALRGKVKAIELEAERTLMLALEAMAPGSSTVSQPLESALATAAAAWHRLAPPNVLRPLVTALG